MSKLEDALWKNYVDVDNQINDLEITSEQYSMLLDERDKVRNELIEVDKTNQEVDVKISQIECDNMKERIRDGITIGTFIVSTITSVWSVWKTFKFDEVATPTSTLGRGILNGVVPRFPKK